MEPAAVLNECGFHSVIRVLDLFSGIGGFSLGLEATGGFQTVAFCERDRYCRAVLAKHWPNVARFRDVRFLDRKKLEPFLPIHAICGGFPCQDISFAGSGEGLAGERSGLWSEFARLISELRPDYAIVENVAALTVRGLLQVLGDLAEVGFAAEWSIVSACSVGAPHLRRRLFIVAYPDSLNGRERVRDSYARQERALQEVDRFASARTGFTARLEDTSVLYGNADGVPFGLERNRAIGNAVVPQVIQAIGQAILEAEAGIVRHHDIHHPTMEKS